MAVVVVCTGEPIRLLVSGGDDAWVARGFSAAKPMNGDSGQSPWGVGLLRDDSMLVCSSFIFLRAEAKPSTHIPFTSAPP